MADQSGPIVPQKKQAKQITKHRSNPFMDAFITSGKGNQSGLRVTQNGDTVEITQVTELDHGQFIKVFTDNVGIWFDLTKPAMRVFAALLKAVQQTAIGRDLLYFKHDGEYAKEFGLGTTTFYRGLEELLSKRIIAKHNSPCWYYINPAIFFNGNRARFIQEYIKTHEKRGKAQ